MVSLCCVLGVSWAKRKDGICSHDDTVLQPALDPFSTRLIAVRMAWIAFAVFDHAFHRQLW